MTVPLSIERRNNMKVCELIALLQTCIQDFELKEIIFTKDKNGEDGVDIIYDNEAMFGQKTETANE